MKNRLFLLIFGLFFVVFEGKSTAFTSFEDHILTSFPACIRAVERCGIPGPLAEEVTRWAIVRQLHENGLNRPQNYSIPGVSCGGWNKEQLETCLERIPNEVELSTVRDSDGVSMYVLKGTGANIVSTATIALLFDYYVTNLSWFSDRERAVWSESQRCSYLISQGFGTWEHVAIFEALEPEREKILRKCSGGYGPGGSRVTHEVIRLDELFDYTAERGREE